MATPIVVAQQPNPEKERIDLIYGVDMEVLLSIKPNWEIEGKIRTRDNVILLGHEVAKHEGLNLEMFTETADGTSLVIAGIVGLTGSQDDAFVILPIQTAQRILSGQARQPRLASK